MVCEHCGTACPARYQYCPECGSALDYPRSDSGAFRTEGPRLARTGGVIVLVGGLVALGWHTVWIYNAASYYLGGGYGHGQLFLLVLGPISIVASAFAIVGGILAIFRKHLVLAIIGGVFCMVSGLSAGPFGLGPVSMIVFPLGLAGLVCVAISHDEFRRRARHSSSR